MLRRLLIRHNGVVTRQECLAASLTARQVDRLLTNGHLVSVFAGVYRDPVAAFDIDRRGRAAVGAGGPGAVASHRMAVALWGMRNYRCDLFEIAVPRRVVRPGLIVHQSDVTFEHTDRHGVPVTTPARTLLDVATVLGAATVARFAETWLSTGVATVDELELIVASHRRHRGARTLMGVLEARSVTGEPDSPAESWLGRLVVRHGLPPPVLHHLVTLASGIVYELDWSYPEHRLALELDGYGVHLRSRDAFEADRQRRNELEIAGWRVLNFTERMVRCRPALVVGQVTRALGGAGYMRR